MAGDHDNTRLEEMLARLIELERQVTELKRSLASDNLRTLEEELKLKGLK